MRVVVSGASIAGLSVAFWLRRIGWQVVVVEQAEQFRDGGQNVDVRGVAHEVLDRMGLTEAVEALNTTETATVIVDQDGSVVAELKSDDPDGATAELEVLRGDFARSILEVLPDDVDIIYGDTIDSVRDDGEGVTVCTTGLRTLDADLLVVAEGVRSTTRDKVFDDRVVVKDELDITMAFGTIPRVADDDSRWRWYTAPGGRQVHLRPDGHGTTRAVLAFAGQPDLIGLDRQDTMTHLREIFDDAGWQARRVLDGLASSDDLYIDRLTQIHASSWHRSRVCLAGDAGWCVTPIAGGGASLALTSGYVLAAYLSTEPDVATALASYEHGFAPLWTKYGSCRPGSTILPIPAARSALRSVG